MLADAGRLVSATRDDKARSGQFHFLYQSSRSSQTGSLTGLWQRSQCSRTQPLHQIWDSKEQLATLQLAYPEHLEPRVFFQRSPAKTKQQQAKRDDYLSLKKKVSPLICATASKITGSVQMSIGVTGPWVGGKGLSVGTPVVRFTTIVNL